MTRGKGRKDNCPPKVSILLCGWGGLLDTPHRSMPGTNKTRRKRANKTKTKKNTEQRIITTQVLPGLTKVAVLVFCVCLFVCFVFLVLHSHRSVGKRLIPLRIMWSCRRRWQLGLPSGSYYYRYSFGMTSQRMVKQRFVSFWAARRCFPNPEMEFPVNQ